jgi:hypothetical protein
MVDAELSARVLQRRNSARLTTTAGDIVLNPIAASEDMAILSAQNIKT